jgi:hypothetical protein
MSNRGINVVKKEAKKTRGQSKLIGEYATMEALIEAKEAELIKLLPDLDLSVLAQRMGK